MDSYSTIESVGNTSNSGNIGSSYYYVRSSTGSISNSGLWTGVEMRIKTPGTKTFSVATGKIIDTWLNFDADDIELKGSPKFR